MKVREPKVEIWEQPKGAGGVFLQIERAGRVCYKSENKITGKVDDAVTFVSRLVKSGHLSVLEHGTVRVLLNKDIIPEFLFHNPFTRVVPYAKDEKFLIVTNYRVLVENDVTWLLQHFYDKEDLENLCRRVTVHFTTQIAVSREANRHRVNSIAEQSTRYCNYSKGKFDGSLAISVPEWIGSCKNYEDYKLDRDMFMELADAVYDGTATSMENWSFANVVAERAYMNLVKNGRLPQEARVILPLDTQTELVHTAFVSDWNHFFDLRALNKTGKAHPDMVAVAKPLYEEFKKRRYIK